jgi:hypothetical protein
MRRVTLPKNSVRGGLLTQGSVLKITANGTSTSPVTRGAWVLAHVLGTPPRPPPPGAGSIDPDTRGATTIREQLLKHRADASCASCHATIDPPGFALESFDVLGGERTKYRSDDKGEKVEVQFLARKATITLGLPVDPSGVFHNSTFADFSDLRTLLLKQERQIARNLAERLVTFATGAGINISDRNQVELILNSIAKEQYGVRSMLHTIIQSDLFRNK